MPPNLDNLYCPKCPPDVGTFNRDAHQVVMDHGLATVICPQGHMVWLDATQQVLIRQDIHSTLEEFKKTNNAATICLEAARLVEGPRQVTHGDKVLHFKNIALAWNGILEMRILRDGTHTPLTALDVTNMLEAMKVARRYCGKHNIDDYVDGAGYAACAGELAEGDINNG
jgi:hypothetical protein